MHQTERRPPVITQVRFGFDHERLYVSLAGTEQVVKICSRDGHELSLKFLKPDGVRFSVRETHGRLRGTFWDRRPVEPYWAERGPGGAAVAAGRLLEVALPLVDLGRKPARRRDRPGEPALPPAVAFFVAVYDAAGAELERHPAYHPIETEVPGRGVRGEELDRLSRTSQDPRPRFSTGHRVSRQVLPGGRARLRATREDAFFRRAPAIVEGV